MTTLLTLLSVAFGSFLTFLLGSLLERRREATSRRVKLRDAYSKWLALQFGAVVDLEEFFELAEAIPRRDQAYLERLESRLATFRPNIYTIFELGFTISSLEKDDKLRAFVARITDLLRQVYSQAHFTATAHDRLKHQEGLLETLANRLKGAPDSEKASPAFEKATQFLASNRELLDGQLAPTIHEQQELSAKVFNDFKEVLKQVAEIARAGD